ncbi:MAG TPA: hypothetical protein VHK69_11700 [Chitinophagaceae bacterium]|jgi:hypothetical protein|nr:hypothetical protein [Chitinophagaceae bacterium]
MNVVNRLLLRAVLLPSPLYRRMGADMGQLRAILHTKLLMDDRRPNTMHLTQSARRTKPINAATIGTILISALMGLIYLMAFLVGNDSVTQMTVYFSFFLFMLAASLISDFTSVLIDVRDNFILLPKPVTDRTLVFARILHIVLHISKIVLPMCAPGAVLVTLRFGVLALFVFLIMVLLLTVFTIFFINALYILILRFTTPQRFQSIISYVQIVFAILLYASYQIFPRLLDNFQAFSIRLDVHPFAAVLPPYWFAAGWKVLHTFEGSSALWALTAVSLVIPVASLYIVIRFLAPSFNAKLALISGSGSAAEPRKRTENKKQGYAARLAHLATRPGPERMGFLFTWKMTTRSRDFRMKVYPGIGYLLVYVVFLLLQRDSVQLSDFRDGTASGRGVTLVALYVCSYLLIAAINQMRFSEKHKAAWIYFVAPVDRPGRVIIGGFKAVLFQFYLPVVAALLLAGLFLSGPAILPNIFLGVVNQLLFAALSLYLSNRVLPFSSFEGMERKSGTFLRGLMVFVLMGLVGMMHYFIFSMPLVVGIAALLSGVAAWLLLDSVSRTEWTKIIRDTKEL